MNDLIKLRDNFKEAVNILDQVIALEDKEKAGEDIKAESESLMGRLFLKMMEMQALQN